MSSAEPSDVSNGKAANNNNNDNPKTGLAAAGEFLFTHKIDGLMWVTRVTTMMFAFLYLFPLISGSQFDFYYKALLWTGATSLLRLSQRLQPRQLRPSRALFWSLLAEDSCHYALFALVFLYTPPATLVLLPVFLFAFLHSTNFTYRLLQAFGLREGYVMNKLSNFVDNQARGVLRLIAFTEIFIMPLSIFMLFIGKGSLLTPVIYYRFLSLRYQSKRNPFTRAVFAELRLSIEILASQPAVPERLRRLCHKMVELVSRLAPTVASA